MIQKSSQIKVRDPDSLTYGESKQESERMHGAETGNRL